MPKVGIIRAVKVTDVTQEFPKKRVAVFLGDSGTGKSFNVVQAALDTNIPTLYIVDNLEKDYIEDLKLNQEGASLTTRSPKAKGTTTSKQVVLDVDENNIDVFAVLLKRYLIIDHVENIFVVTNHKLLENLDIPDILRGHNTIYEICSINDKFRYINFRMNKQLFRKVQPDLSSDEELTTERIIDILSKYNYNVVKHANNETTNIDMNIDYHSEELLNEE